VFTGASPGLAASSSPRYRCRPSPCTGLSPARSTTAAPPRPWPLSRRRAQPGHHAGSMETGRPGTVPVFTAIRSPKEEPGSAPAASLQVRRRPSPQPPGHRLHDSRKFPAPFTAGGCAPLPAQIRQIRAGIALRGFMTPVPRVLLSGPLTRHTPSGSTGPPWLCQDCSCPSRRLPGPAVLSSSQAAATARRWWPFTSTRISSASRRTKAALNAFDITFDGRLSAGRN
jgi:hypothetical protein